MSQPRASKRAGKRSSTASRGRKTASAPRRRAPAPPSGPLHERILALQRRLGVPADGVVGPVLLSRIEDLIENARPRLRSGPTEPGGAPTAALTVSTRGLEAIVRFEVGSEAAYEKKYRRPIWPGGESGVTAGIGYDLGMSGEAAIRDDWRGQVSDADLELLASVARIVGAAAKAALARVRSVDVPLFAARQVFAVRTLPRYAQATRKVFPGVQDLPADAQSALLSLVFNRGASLAGNRREEMRAIRDLVPSRDLTGIAGQLRAMTRLWEGMGLPGLIRRRRDEADLVEQAARTYATEELVRV